jgi:integrase
MKLQNCSGLLARPSTPLRNEGNYLAFAVSVADCLSTGRICYDPSRRARARRGLERAMSVRVVRFRDGRSWEVDIRCELPDGTRYRERKVAPAVAKKEAELWAQRRQAHLVRHGKPDEEAAAAKEVPTVEQFRGRFIEEFCRAERQKPSGIAAKETIFDRHLVPLIGAKRLDRITREDVQHLKAALVEMNPKTVNNVLSTLGKMLRVAEEWEVISEMPCRVRLLRQQAPEMAFYDFGEWERLVEAAEKIDQRILVAVLLGGEAGVRSGEMTALEWTDVDARQRLLTVARSEWKGHVTLPKGGRTRKVPMTTRLADALQKLRHLRGARVLYADQGGHATQKVLRTWMAAAQKRAGLKDNGGVHILRHTFCSHLSMKGAPAMAIKELAGHANLGTTQRYMHLSPAAKDSAIRLLESRDGGDQGETGRPLSPESNEIN